MGNSNVRKFFRNVQRSVSKHSPEILTGIGIGGMASTVILAVKATPKALELIEDKKEEMCLDPEEKLKSIEVAKTCWKCYSPAAITFILSTICLVSASRVSLRRNAALATAYKLSETALTEYKAKVVETIGEKKEKAIRDKIDKDHVDQLPVSKNEVIITDKGDTLCLDYSSKRYFKSDINQLKKVVNILNKQMLCNDYISLNDFYDEIGLDHTPTGYDLGWRVDKGLLDLELSSQIADDGTPCIVVNFNISPMYGYSSFA